MIPAAACEDHHGPLDQVHADTFFDEQAAARSRFSRVGQDGADGPFVPVMDRETAVRDRWLCRAQSDQAAAVLEKGVVLDVLRYDVEVPVVQTCEHVAGDVTNRFRVRAQVVRTGELDHPEGVMIDRVQVTRR
jgi:intracellular multiplication protein IcmL